jgi:hypothetical protein
MAVDDDASYHSQPASVGLVVVFFGIWVFFVLQVGFWWTIASKEVQHTVAKKTAALHGLRDVLSRNGLVAETSFLDYNLAQAEATSRPFTADDERTQHAHNARRTALWMGPVLAVATLLPLGCVAYNRRHGHRLAFGHRAGLVLVLLGYLPEVLLFLAVVDRFQAVGDFDLLRHGLGLVKR